MSEDEKKEAQKKQKEKDYSDDKSTQIEVEETVEDDDDN